AHRREQELAQQLHQSQKLEALGHLAGGVAHDINNVLGAIMAAASLLEGDLSPDHPSGADVQDILDACRRGRELTRNLLGFARKGRFLKEELSINRLAEETEQLLRRTTDRRVRIESRLDPKLLHVEGDRGQLGQMLMNLCLNAVDAMPDRGTMIISTENELITDPVLASARGVEPGSYVRIGVSDTGVGMDAEMIEHIFEPFFTTKPLGEGTGLGLSMVYGTVKSHGGAVWVESEPGEGSTVTLLLPGTPRLRPTSEPAARVAGEASVEVKGILLVDDEELIRSSSSRMLERLGYRVIAAADGREALELFAAHRDRISLVILDVVMPEMDGLEALERLRAEDPSIRVLVASGYGRDDRVDGLLSAGANGFIQKPFHVVRLADAIASVMR
ncbi:MAG: response regulator, partial [Deltaproteobacteria bacterium]|nr:response regulator [Deltaproteobacteria bacterium]MBW2530793.1 response regulator [Deltaproteobacteria bacterium]